MTLVEMMVVVVILGIISAVSVTLITTILDSNLRTVQTMAQQTTIENTFGYLNSKFADTRRGQLGYAEGGSIDPLSVAGDQLLFSSENGSGQSTCYRLMYFQELKQIRVATRSGSCENQTQSANSVLPRRGPNENVGTTENPRYFISDPGNSLFDPAIDSAYPEVAALCENSPLPAWCGARSWILADGVDNSFPASSPESEEVEALIPSNAGGAVAISGGKKFLPLFRFLDTNGNKIQVDNQASTSSSTALNQNTISSIGTIEVRGLISPLSDPDVYGDTKSTQMAGGASWARLRYWGQSFAMQQTCSIIVADGSGGSGGPVQASGLPRFPSQSDSVPDHVLSPSLAAVEYTGGIAPGVIQVTTPGRYLIVAGLLQPETLWLSSDLATEYGGFISLFKADIGTSNGLQDLEEVIDEPETISNPTVIDGETTFQVLGVHRFPGLSGQMSTVAHFSRNDAMTMLVGYEPATEAPELSAEQATVNAYVRMYWIGK